MEHVSGWGSPSSNSPIGTPAPPARSPPSGEISERARRGSGRPAVLGKGRTPLEPPTSGGISPRKGISIF